MKNENASFEFCSLMPSHATVSYVEVTRDEEIMDLNSSHVHPECEIYFNVSGDVSFMVENRIYAISPGDVVITRPYEYHHCIYHSNELHRHYCVRFSPPATEGFLDKFFSRNVGENNLLILGRAKRDELTECLDRLRAENVPPCERYACMLRMLSVIEAAQSSVREHKAESEIDAVLSYIEDNYTENVNVGTLAASIGMSVNTLERHFRRVIGMSPLTYMKKKRLAHAARMLAGGSSVIEACTESGFSDYSHFIVMFKEAYGMTPLKYKKAIGCG